MQKQYGKEEGKKVYFATIRKQAMSEEGLRNWFGKSSGTTKSGRKVEDGFKLVVSMMGNHVRTTSRNQL